MPRIDYVQIRQGLAATWVSINPTLGLGEPGQESNTGKLKVGDGVQNWNNLNYVDTYSQMMTVPTSAKGAANGVATLGATSKITASQLSTGVANGLATLDAGGKVPAAQLPPVSGRAFWYQKGLSKALNSGPNFSVTLATSMSVTGDGVKAFKLTGFIDRMKGTVGGDRFMLRISRSGVILVSSILTDYQQNPLHSLTPELMEMPMLAAVDTPPVGACTYTFELVPGGSGWNSGLGQVAPTATADFFMLEQVV